MSNWQWSYELTLDEMLGHHEVQPTAIEEPVLALTEGIPFSGVSCKLVPGFEKLEYQVAITSIPRPGTIWEAMISNGIGPTERSGDRRSGVLLFEGGQTVGFYVDPGFHGSPEWLLWVNPDRRGEGLGKQLFVLWFSEFPRHHKLHPHLTFNQYAKRTLAAAFKQYIKLCIFKGLPITERVRQSVGLLIEHSVAV